MARLYETGKVQSIPLMSVSIFLQYFQHLAEILNSDKVWLQSYFGRIRN